MSAAKIPPTPENIRAALAFVSPDQERPEWVKVGMAVKDALNGEGFELFDEWSKGGQSYNATDTRDTWKSIKADGDITVGTLFGLAKRNGWKPDGPARQETEAERQARERQRAERAKQEAETKARAIEEAARKTARLELIAGPARPDHPYLVRKGIQPTPNLFEATAQQVAETIGYHPKSDGAGSTVAIGEGVSTTATAQQATGYHGVAALSASNLPKVAKAMRERLPKARLLILGDLGNGQKYAEQAARENAAVLAVPEFTPEQLAAHQAQHGKPPTDFNDLAALAGPDAVRGQIDRPGQPEARPPKPPAKPVKDALARGFKLTGQGVFFIEEASDEGEKTEGRKIYVCSPLRVTAETRDNDQGQWGRLLEWEDRDGHPHKLAIPMAMLEGESGGVCALLADGGLTIGDGSKARNLLVRYIKQCHAGTKARCVSKIGWHDGVYVLPTHTLGEREGERVLFQTGSASPGDFRQRGTATEWRATVATLCAGNSRPMTAIGFAFAAPLLRFLPGAESGGAHFREGSSCGKSTALWAAASVFGAPEGDHSFRKEWRGTDNGLEGLATSRNDSLLILDEMGQVDGKQAGTIAYMLANGQPKARLQDRIALREMPTWRLLFLSSGEISLADHMAAAGTKIKAGQETRLADIPAMPFNGFGVFDTLNGHPSGPALSDAIKDAALHHYGAVGLEFIEHAARIQHTLPERLKATIARFVDDVVPKGASGQVDRVAKRFGLVLAGLELAGEFGLTGWDQDQAAWAVKQCFAGWLHQRGGAGDQEETAILAQVRGFFEANGESRFADWHAAERVANGLADEGRAVMNRVGFRRKDRDEGYTYFVLPESFKTEICKGLDPDKAARVLKAHGWIEPEKSGKSTQNQRLPGFGKPARCYVFTSKIWDSAE